MPTHSTHASSRRAALLGFSRGGFAAFALAVLIGCAPKPASTAAAPSPVTAPAAPAWLSCPDPTDGPSIVANDIDEAHKAWTSNPATPLPPACVFTALSRVENSITDSTNAHALALAAEVRKHGPETRELLAAEVVLLARGQRYAEVSRTYDKLVALDPTPALEVSQLAMAAARQRGDTASLLRILSKSVTRGDANSAMRSEYNVVRQAKRLWEAINEARGLVRQNPRYVAAYPSLVGNFGTLGLADSVAATSRRAFAAGAQRSAILPSVETLVGAMLRHAALYGSTYDWDSEIAAAKRVDAALSTPSTKFLTAAMIVYAADAQSAEIGAMVRTPALASAGNGAASPQHTAGCQRIPSVTASLDLAERRLGEGGDKYRSAAQVRSGLSAAREKLASLQGMCSQSGA